MHTNTRSGSPFWAFRWLGPGRRSRPIHFCDNPSHRRLTVIRDLILHGGAQASGSAMYFPNRPAAKPEPLVGSPHLSGSCATEMNRELTAPRRFESLRYPALHGASKHRRYSSQAFGNAETDFSQLRTG